MKNTGRQRVIEDQEIIRRIQSGDQNVLVVCYKQYEEFVAGFLSKNGARRDWLDDLIQETMIALWLNAQREGFLLTSKLTSYLCSIAKNQLLKVIEKRTRGKREFSGLIVDDHILFSERHTDLQPTDQQDLSPAMNNVLEAFQKLTPRQRKILSLYFFEQMNGKEIMTRMNLTSTDGVKTMKYKAMKRLRKILQKKFPNTHKHFIQGLAA